MLTSVVLPAPARLHSRRVDYQWQALAQESRPVGWALVSLAFVHAGIFGLVASRLQANRDG
ncbi:MAG: hypothetical protein ACTHQQ_05870 [Solirubrobacteraceae bacterium]